MGADGQVYFAAPNSWTMGIFNRARMTLSPTSITVSPGAHKTFTVFEILQPFLGTNPATFSAQSSNNAVAKLSSFTNSGGQGTGTILGVKPGTVKFTVVDGTGNSTPLNVTVP